MKRIEFGEFRTNNVMRQHVNECLDNNWITGGKKVQQFEEKFAQTFGYKYAVMTSSGTTADMCAVMTLYEKGFNQGDGIIVPALSFIATSTAVRAAGFTPIFIDIKRETLNIDETKIEETIKNSKCKIAAIMVVNTMGKPCKMDTIVEICNKYNLLLIIDCCESHLCKFKNKLMSEYGNISTYSGYTAHVTMFGEGGMLCTNNKKIYNWTKSIRSHGRPVDSLFFSHERFGLNFKNTDLHASIGLGSLEDLHTTFHQRDMNLRQIRGRCAFLRDISWLSEEETEDFNCPHGFSVTVKNPNMFPILTETLEKYNIHWKRNFGCIPTQHKVFDYLGYKLGDFPEAEYVGNNGLHIGCHPYLSQEDIDRIVIAFTEFYNKIK